jgi:ribosomal-protein-alanine N-acetyltransferase
MVEIREIRPEEYGFLREMLYEAVYIPEGKERPPFSIVERPEIAKYIDGFGRAGDAAYVLDDNGTLVGAAWARLYRAEEETFGFIDENTPEFSIAILPAYRNKAFGRSLMTTLFEKLRTDGREQISLNVDKRNPALRLYHAFGFAVVREVGVACTMVKNLRDESVNTI